MSAFTVYRGVRLAGAPVSHGRSVEVYCCIHTISAADGLQVGKVIAGVVAALAAQRLTITSRATQRNAFWQRQRARRRSIAGKAMGEACDQALYGFSSCGEPRVVEHLERALEYQWRFGFPRMPLGEPQLTHGMFKYIGGMQPLAAREFLRLHSGATVVLDPFCGSGTVLLEALLSGLTAVGCDASPLAVFVASQHCDLANLDIDGLGQTAKELVAPLLRTSRDWQKLREAISSYAPCPLQEALWFAFMIALQSPKAATKTRHKLSTKQQDIDPNGRLASQLFLAAVERLATGLRALREVLPAHSRPLSLHRCDMRQLRLDRPADAIVTSPPYPGVYDYLSTARLMRCRIVRTACGIKDADAGVGDFLASEFEDPTTSNSRSRSPEAFDSQQEIGARKMLRRLGTEAFAAEWRRQQECWLNAASANLKLGGAATLMIGDGEALNRSQGDGAYLESTLEVARACNFEVVATATIHNLADDRHTVKGMRRSEHAIHLRKTSGGNQNMSSF